MDRGFFGHTNGGAALTAAGRVVSGSNSCSSIITSTMRKTRFISRILGGDFFRGMACGKTFSKAGS